MLVVDDDAIVRAWIRATVDGTPFHVAGEVGTPEEIGVAAANAADVLLVDQRLGRHAGTELVRALRRSGVTSPALIMTAGTEHGLNESAREAGAQGTLLKTGTAAELLTAMRRVVEGETSFDRRHPPRAARGHTLTPRERDVLRLVARGATNVEIATSLGLGSETVKTLLSRACAKLGVRRRAEAVHAAHERGLL